MNSVLAWPEALQMENMGVIAGEEKHKSNVIGNIHDLDEASIAEE